MHPNQFKITFYPPAMESRLLPRRKSIKRQRRKAETEILIRLSKQSVELVTVFEEPSKHLLVIFPSHRAAYKVKKPSTHV